jgi:putative nucleotidyltransferase with HDIG domain
MNPIVALCNALGQALATMSLYAPTHPMRAAARERALGTLRHLVAARGPLRLNFLDGEVVVGSRVLPELRGWDWGVRFSQAGVQRLEVDDAPIPTDRSLELLLTALHTQLTAPAGTPFEPFAITGLRAGPLGVLTSADETAEASNSLLDAIALDRLDEEADAVRWIHDQTARGRAVPMAEVELVVRSLATAMHRDQHIVLPLLELKTVDQYTTTHSCNVAMLSMGLAEQLGLSSTAVREIGTAALLHDIGKVLVPPEILVKPGKLTDQEFSLMKRHPVDGARIISERGRGHALAAVVAYEHHIWEDGTGGYPHFAYARRCHYASRLVHVCDLYDALSTKRPYRDAWPRHRTLAMLRERAGIEVDREIVEAFVQLSAEADEVRSPLTDTPQDDWTGAVTRAAQAAAGSGRPDTFAAPDGGTGQHVASSARP